MDHYMEVKRSHGSTPSRDYETLIEDGPPDGNRNTKFVRPNISDFLCDVELAAKRALTPELFAQFHAVYIDQSISVDVLSREDLDTIIDQVARMLVRKQIYPMIGYLRGRSVGGL
jgi:hypothetical protein